MGADLQKTNILPVMGAEGRVHADTWGVGGQGQESWVEGTQPLSAGMFLIFLQLEKRPWEHGQMICAAEVSEELS